MTESELTNDITSIDEQEWKYAFRLNKVATLGFLLLNFLVMAFHCQPYKRNWQVRPDPEGESSFASSLGFMLTN